MAPLVEHGGLDADEARSLGLDPSRIIDLSQNLAPLPPPEAVQQAIAGCDYRPYPATTYRRLREALARRHGVGAEWCLPTNGAAEAIFLACRALLSPGDRVLVMAPTFGEYERAARLSGAQVTFAVARAEDGFLWDVGAVCRQARALRPQVLFLCCPNNPTGVYLGRQEVEALAEAVGGGVLVLDEAFVDFVQDPWDSLELARGGRVLALRSLTKAFALAGLRLGYALGRPELLERLRAHQPPWSVNAFAVAAGIACAAASDHLAQVRCAVARARADLAEGLRGLGLSVLEGAANFVLVRVGEATAFRHRLLLRGVCVRDCTSFGLPAHVRVAVPPQEQVRRVVEAFAAVLQESGRVP
ncbi:MAG TPA: histidinol-phosphate transaminase [Dehalococcoidia bacterium]|nr:histidinol-phosphate transaminase [Dehalococcoidia bacterium]